MQLGDDVRDGLGHGLGLGQNGHHLVGVHQLRLLPRGRRQQVVLVHDHVVRGGKHVDEGTDSGRYAGLGEVFASWRGGNKSNTPEVNNERFLISTRQNSGRIFGIRCL